MRSEQAEPESSIERRTVRAARESMTIVPDAPGLFRVYSGETAVYTVDLVSGACTCRDAEYNGPESGCKHLRRTEMEAGIREIPDLPARLDVEIMIDAREAREEPEVEPEREAITVDADASKPSRAVATDGGQVVTPNPQGSEPETCDHPDCEHGLGKERPVLCWTHWEQRQEARR